MALEEVKVTANLDNPDGSETKVARTATFQYDFGSGVVEGAQMYGQQIVDQLYRTAARVKVQNIARNMLERNEEPASVVAFFSQYKLGQDISRPVNVVNALTTQLKTMEDAAAIETLKQLAAARGLSLESLL